MAEIGVSETQFAFMFFHKLSSLYNDSFNKIVALNTFQEGNPNNRYRGTDLVVDQFFIQFKLPQYINRSGNSKFKHTHNPKYFHFEAYNSRGTHCGQYDFLKHHSQDPSKTVLYISPSFSDNLYTQPEHENFWFTNFYRSAPSEIDDFSCSVNIADLNWVWTGNTQHSISYKDRNTHYYAHSNPIEHQKTSLSKLIIGRRENLRNTLRSLNRKGPTLSDHVKELNRYLSKPILPNENGTYNIIKLQLQILTEYNVFWLPSIYPMTEKMSKIFTEINKS